MSSAPPDTGCPAALWRDVGIIPVASLGAQGWEWHLRRAVEEAVATSVSPGGRSAVARVAALDEMHHPHDTCEIEWGHPPQIRTVQIATDAVSRALRRASGAVPGLRADLRSWTGTEPADSADQGSRLVMAVGDVVARHADEAVLAVRCGPRNWIARPDPASVVPSRVCWAGPLVFGVPVGAAGPVFVVGGVEIRCCEHAVGVVAQLVQGEAVTVPVLGTECAAGLLGALWGAGLVIDATAGSDR